jgi:hypothetical protein
MDVCVRLESDVLRSHRRWLPVGWIAAPGLRGYGSLAALVSAVKRLDWRSDEILTALLARGPDDHDAAETIIVALLPMILGRCSHDRDRVDELVGELAIVVGDYMAGTLTLDGSPRRVANILLDRAWGKVRVPARRVRRNVSADPQLLCRTIVDERTDPERVAVNRVALAAARDSLARSGPGYVSLVRAWNTAVSLIDKDDRDAGERVQLKYARRVLRRCASPDLVA